MTHPRFIDVVLYGRAGCRLCEEAVEYIRELQRDYPIRLQQVDIENHPDLLRRFALEIPVVRLGDLQFAAPIDVDALRLAVEADAECHSRSRAADDGTLAKDDR